MRLHFVWIGKTRDRHCAALIADYLDRIRRFAPFEVSELKEVSGGLDDKRVVEVESARILSAIERDDFVILLDENGRGLTSVELSELIERHRQNGVKRLGLVIGGFAGVSDEVKSSANLRLSLSPLTLTHELARVILTEQVYRAFTLLAGLPYHKY